MKLTPYLLAVCLLSSSLGSACSSTPDTSQEVATQEKKTEEPTQSAQELFLLGNKQLDLEEYDKAVVLYDRALEVDPERWDIYMNKGIAHSSAQQFSEAVNAIDAALAHGGDAQPEVYFNLGNIYQNHGLYAQSIKAYRSSLALRERPHVDTVFNIAAALMFMSETDKARETYDYLQTLVPDDPRVYVGLGLLEQSQDHYDIALEHYDHAILIDPGYAHAYYMKGSLLRLTEKPKGAIENLERYIQLAPNGPYVEPAKTRVNTLKKKL